MSSENKTPTFQELINYLDSAEAAMRAAQAQNKRGLANLASQLGGADNREGPMSAPPPAEKETES